LAAQKLPLAFASCLSKVLGCVRTAPASSTLAPFQVFLIAQIFRLRNRSAYAQITSSQGATINLMTIISWKKATSATVGCHSQHCCWLPSGISPICHPQLYCNKQKVQIYFNDFLWHNRVTPFSKISEKASGNDAKTNRAGTK
jgi:hypothetical protein